MIFGFEIKYAQTGFCYNIVKALRPEFARIFWEIIICPRFIEFATSFQLSSQFLLAKGKLLVCYPRFLAKETDAPEWTRPRKEIKNDYNLPEVILRNLPSF